MHAGGGADGEGEGQADPTLSTETHRSSISGPCGHDLKEIKF